MDTDQKLLLFLVVIPKISLCKEGTINKFSHEGNFKALTNYSNIKSKNPPYWLTEEEKNGGIKWYGYNPHFGWKIILEPCLKDIPGDILKGARNELGLIVNIPAGNRKRFYDLSTWWTEIIDPYLPRILHMIKRGHISINSNQCVWVSVSMLVHLDDPKCAEKMMMYLCRKDNVKKLMYMCLFKPKKRKRKIHWKIETVSHHLNHNPQFGYQIRRAKGPNPSLEYLMHPKTKGKYVCILTDMNYTPSHAVGIDCDSQLIYDCCEDTALYLTLTNMNKWVGAGEILDKIHCIGEIYKYGNDG